MDSCANNGKNNKTNHHAVLKASLNRLFGCSINRKSFGVNTACVTFVIVYVIAGSLIMLHLEQPFEDHARHNQSHVKTQCIRRMLSMYNGLGRVARNERATHAIVRTCLSDKVGTRQRWTLVNAALYVFGIITTLGYGMVEPVTSGGRIFSVIFGLLGIPITMIIFANFGKFLQHFVLYVYYKYIVRGNAGKDQEKHSITTSGLILIIFGYLTIGAILLPLLNGHFNFSDGFYWSFLCLTAIEYGQSVPENNALLPIVMTYICLGIAISTITIDIGSSYVRRLHYFGRKIRNIAHVNIWFGAKRLKVLELINAIGQNLGIEPSVIGDIDIAMLIDEAIKVKEGKLNRVSQRYAIVQGIWPPELVPLFMREGPFPEFMDM